MEEDLNTFLENFEEKFKKTNNRMDQNEFVKRFVENINFPVDDVKVLFNNIDSENRGWISFEQLHNYCNQNKDHGIMITPEIVSEAKQLYEYCLENYKVVTYDLLLKAGAKENSNLEGIQKIFKSFKNYPNTVITESSFSECVSKYEQQISQFLIDTTQDSAPLSISSNATKIDSIIEKLFEALMGTKIDGAKLKNITSNLEFLKLYSNDVKTKDKQFKSKLEQLQSELEIMQETINKYKLELENSQNEKENLSKEIRNSNKNNITDYEKKINDLKNEKELLKVEITELNNRLKISESDLNSQIENVYKLEKEREELIKKLNNQSPRPKEESFILPKTVGRANSIVYEKLSSKYEEMSKEQLIKEISFLDNFIVKEKEVQIESLNEELQFCKKMLNEKIEENTNLNNDYIYQEDKIKALQEIIRKYQSGKSIMPINNPLISLSEINQPKVEKGNLNNNIYPNHLDLIPTNAEKNENTSENQIFHKELVESEIIVEALDVHIESNNELLPIHMRESLEKNMFIIEEEKETGKHIHENESKKIEISEETQSSNKLTENLEAINLHNISKQETINDSSKNNIGFINKTEENYNLNNINLIKSIEIVPENKFNTTSNDIKEKQPPSNLNAKNVKLSASNENSSQYSENEYTTTNPESDNHKFETFNPNKSPLASKVLGTLIHNAKSISRFSCMFTNQSSSVLTYDFLFLKNSDIIKELIQKNKGKYEENEDVFNDFVFQISSLGEKIKKEKTIIIINSTSIYFLHKEKYKMIQKISIDTITSIILLKNSPYLLILKIENESDLFIEIIHRIEFIVFLSKIYKKRNGVKLPVPCSSRIKKFIDGKEVNDFTEDVIKGISAKTTKFEFYNNTFENALKSGYLQRNHITKTFLFGNDKSEWINKFYALTNIGIFGFDTPNSEPSELIPLSESSRINIETTKIKIINSIKTVILQANSMFEANNWYKMLIKCIKNCNSNSKKNHS